MTAQKSILHLLPQLLSQPNCITITQETLPFSHGLVILYNSPLYNI